MASELFEDFFVDPLFDLVIFLGFAVFGKESSETLWCLLVKSDSDIQPLGLEPGLRKPEAQWDQEERSENHLGVFFGCNIGRLFVIGRVTEGDTYQSDISGISIVLHLLLDERNSHADHAKNLDSHGILHIIHQVEYNLCI